MLTEEIIKKVRWIQFTTQKIVNEILGGQYKSLFKGQGMQFSEHRIYVPGDDVRHINWSASARSKEPLIKKFEEERELTVFLVVDFSGSQAFGTQKCFKSEIATQIAAMLAMAASMTNDKIGLLIFTDQVEYLIAPQKGKNHVLRMIRDMLVLTPKSLKTNLKTALKTTDQVMKHNGIIFIISDFIATDYETSLKKLSQRHDIVAIQLEDPTEQSFPPLGYTLLQNLETQQIVTVKSSDKEFQNLLHKQSSNNLQSFCKGGKMGFLRIQTKDNYADALVQFFQRRAHTRS